MKRSFWPSTIPACQHPFDVASPGAPRRGRLSQSPCDPCISRIGRCATASASISALSAHCGQNSGSLARLGWDQVGAATMMADGRLNMINDASPSFWRSDAQGRCCLLNAGMEMVLSTYPAAACRQYTPSAARCQRPSPPLPQPRAKPRCNSNSNHQISSDNPA